MHPTEVLSQEHRAIENMLGALEEQIRAAPAGQPFPRRFFDEALDFFRNFADGCHHAKEENLLFPRMKERGVPENGGPIGVMLAEHEQGRGHNEIVKRGNRNHSFRLVVSRWSLVVRGGAFSPRVPNDYRLTTND